MSDSQTSRSLQEALRTWNIDQWGSGYFDIDPQGRVVVRPHGNAPEQQRPALPITELATRLQQAGLRLPVLVRFTDILHDRVEQLCAAFDRAIQEQGYDAHYTAVYPIKVNQQRRVVEELLATPERGRGRVGLEAGSKPELMAVLALSSEHPSTIVCNGYKDREYIRLALMGEKLGHHVYLVVEKHAELELIIEEADRLGVEPRIGVRARLSSIGKGNWQNTGGEKSKFGLTARQVQAVVDHMRAIGRLDALQLVHFHLGSQIANIRDIQRGLRECTRFYQSLREAGAAVEVVDVGGGLGVDYEGTRSRSYCSINYSMDEYANNVVGAFQQLCQATGLPHPQIISESGRALTAHHAVLITNVIDEERHDDALPERSDRGDAQLDVLWRTWEWLGESADPRLLVEYYHDIHQAMTDLQDRFVLGDASLAVRAEGEAVHAAASRRLRARLDHRNRAHREILDELDEKLADKLFVNFSLFQSVPDVWGIDQIFPVIPLSNLDQPPVRRGVIQDITCDSDGRIERYVDGQGVETTLPLPEWKAGEEKLLGLFLVGAYQEILGDLHNLFGDTDSIDVSLDDNGQWRLGTPITGDSVANVLRYVNFDPDRLRNRLQRQLIRSDVSSREREQFLEELEAGLEGYTYLEQ
ncbi:biosynthetic arginine decarboxylase [Kushneria phosphatilytica]|uniref:Biosynthetic arginine decarboxylase n=1 Tax=Kushneria phosphatilytica TaxID=657387 RepID=A0A1S1NRQ8_9GAMM|nr:biosynthetic arginine decarboxylase [Kushneria phosphatilytica]OHV07609.1 arginine decarboxylase [Kushneria phosphatilytica]QEL10097.1 biosynthetic arginine decarboxylase [Kushneria phosphatilytica]